MGRSSSGSSSSRKEGRRGPRLTASGRGQCFLLRPSRRRPRGLGSPAEASASAEAAAFRIPGNGFLNGEPVRRRHFFDHGSGFNGGFVRLLRTGDARSVYRPGSSSDSTIGESARFCSSAAPEGDGVLSSRSVMPNPLRKRRFPSGRLPSLRRPVWRRRSRFSGLRPRWLSFGAEQFLFRFLLRFSCSSSSISVFSVRWNSVETLRNCPALAERPCDLRNAFRTKDNQRYDENHQQFCTANTKHDNASLFPFNGARRLRGRRRTPHGSLLDFVDDPSEIRSSRSYGRRAQSAAASTFTQRRATPYAPVAHDAHRLQREQHGEALPNLTMPAGITQFLLHDGVGFAEDIQPLTGHCRLRGWRGRDRGTADAR